MKIDLTVSIPEFRISMVMMTLLTLMAMFSGVRQMVPKVKYLSKGPSDLKQNGTQEKTQFSGTVTHCLSHGVVLFVPTVSIWNRQIEASHWLEEEF